ncbi:MAG: rhodanese-like domain-containing protein [Candidatus Bathyarchaeia archaeon]
MKVKSKGLLAIAALLVLVFVFSSVTGTVPPQNWQGSIAPLQNISVQEAYAYIKYGINLTNMVVLDVRTPAEYNASHIKGGSAFPSLEAINIPYNLSNTAPFLANLSAYGTASCPLTGHQNDLIIVLCRVGIRSSGACEVLVSNPYVNFTNVYNVIGGFQQYYLDTIASPTNTSPILYWNFSDTVVVNATNPASVVDLNVTEAYKMMTSGSSLYGRCSLVVDARTTGEYDTAHIVNSTTAPVLSAISIPWVDGSELISPSSPLYGHYNDPIIVYCQNISTCAKSGDASSYLVNHGFTKVYDLSYPNGGGIAEWTAEGYPTAATTIANTFGYTAIGGSSGWWGPGNAMWGCKFTSPTNAGTITQISIYMSAYSGAINATAFIYADNSGTPSTLLATSSQVTGIGTTASWINFGINYGFSANTVYWFMVMTTATHYVWWNLGSTNQMDYSRLYTYPNAPNPWGSDNTYQPWQMSIYATYTSP